VLVVMNCPLVALNLYRYRRSHFCSQGRANLIVHWFTNFAGRDENLSQGFHKGLASMWVRRRLMARSAITRWIN
jgi:hypothetical protein